MNRPSVWLTDIETACRGVDHEAIIMVFPDNKAALAKQICGESGRPGIIMPPHLWAKLNARFGRRVDEAEYLLLRIRQLLEAMSI
jgi:hypothetical protein